MEDNLKPSLIRRQHQIFGSSFEISLTIPSNIRKQQYCLKLFKQKNDFLVSDFNDLLLDKKVLTIGAHWSSLEPIIIYEGHNNLDNDMLACKS